MLDRIREDTDDGIYYYRINRNAPRRAHGCGERRPILRLLYEDPCAHALLWQRAIIFEAGPHLVFPGGSRCLARLSLPTPKHCSNIAVFHPSPTLGLSMIKIEKNIAVPTSSYPFDQMEVGDSFVVIDQTKIAGARVAAYNCGMRKEKKFASRRVTEGVRIWRIA
jgi:hypothetical protein